MDLIGEVIANTFLGEDNQDLVVCVDQIKKGAI
jgi:hypothetical protein